jgi:hypothetical protein
MRQFGKTRRFGIDASPHGLSHFQFGTAVAMFEANSFFPGGLMSKELRSAIRGSGLGAFIGAGFGLAVLSTMGFDHMTLFEGLILLSCSMFGGCLFGALIGSTGAFRREPALEAEERYAVRTTSSSPVSY